MADLNIDVIIKFGGSAITEKQELETLNPSALETAAQLVRQCLDRKLTCVVVHGAGSFGHHHAKKYKVNEGWCHLHDDGAINNVKRGFCLTRQSVTKLHQFVIDALLNQDIPAAGIALYSAWIQSDGKLVQHDFGMMEKVLMSGLVPVLHGDCIFDTTRGCGILSGDTIIKTVCRHFNVRRVVFLTNVQGVYSEPPESNPDAALHPVLYVKNGHIVKNDDKVSDKGVVSDCKENDVTGGMTLKLQTAVDIVTGSDGRTEVYVCKLGSEYGRCASLNGQVDGLERQGTAIRALAVRE